MAQFSASVQHLLSLWPECDRNLGDGEVSRSHSPPLKCSQSGVEERPKINAHTQSAAGARSPDAGQHGVAGGQCGRPGIPGVEEGGREGASNALAHAGHLAWLRAALSRMC